MEYNDFLIEIKRKLIILNLEFNDEMVNKLYEYMLLIIEWNDKINLTAIIDPIEMIDKHFIDSLSVSKYLKNSNVVMDIGTGAGFPGIPLAIFNENVKFILADSLNKRINFLKIVIDKLNLKNVTLIHGRAEDLGHNIDYREKIDTVVSRAVANLSVLLEYTVPFIKMNGEVICMKASGANQEIENAKNAINVLGVEILNIDNFKLPYTDYERNIIRIKKIKKISNKFPRKSGIPSKNPL